MIFSFLSTVQTLVRALARLRKQNLHSLEALRM